MKKTASIRAKRVIWAVDAFQDSPKLQLRALQAFLKMHGDVPVWIKPVAVLGSGAYDPQTRSFPLKWRELATAALKNLNRSLSNLKIEGLQPPHLIRAEADTVTEAVHALVRFALEESASMILVSSHARRGAARLVMGSFAETLVMHSPLPVLVANPSSHSHQRMTTILFPTDLSRGSRRAFERLVTLAAQLEMQIVLFHKMDLPMSSLKASFLIPRVSAESIRQRKAELHAQGKDWIRYGEMNGVRTKFQLQLQDGHLLEKLMETLERLGPKAMLAMASQKGRLASALVGSLTRQVLRSAPCPVLVFHANQPSLVRIFSENTKQLAFQYSAHPVLT